MPIKQNKGKTLSIGHMTSQDVGLCLGFQYQTWTPSYGSSIVQIFLCWHLWFGILSEHHASWRLVSKIRGSSVKFMRFLGAGAHSMVHSLPQPLLISLHPKSGVFPTACLHLRLLHLKSYKERGIHHSSLCRTPSASPFWTQMVMNLE